MVVTVFFTPVLSCLLQDRIASLNGRTVQYVIRQDKAAFIRLIGISVLQSAASAVLAPSLRHVADALAMTWRRRLTAAAHSRYFKGNTFYTTSQLAGMCVWGVLPCLASRVIWRHVSCSFQVTPAALLPQQETLYSTLQLAG